MYDMTGVSGCGRNAWGYLPWAETEHTQLQPDEAFQKVFNRASTAGSEGLASLESRVSWGSAVTQV